ncbi:MAG: DUF924 family protein [Pseudomonadota bacterium]
MRLNTKEIIDFWEELGPERWYRGDDALDAEIRQRFEAPWVAALRSPHFPVDWTPQATLALLLLFDQFPRNMFRGTGLAFASDAAARAITKRAIDAGHDRRTETELRQFYYLPLEHSEALSDQARAVRLMAGYAPGSQLLRHARAHRDVIRQFGRFPYRNEALGRRSSVDELAYLAAGGYAFTLKSFPE